MLTAVGNSHLALHPAYFLLQSELFHVPGVVGVVVEGGHGAQLVKALYEHAFGVHVGESQGTYEMFHPAFLAPLCHGIEQGAAHLDVVDEVYPPEAHVLHVPRLVGTVVDDGCHAAHYLPVLPGQEQLGGAELVGSVLAWVEGVECIFQKIGYGVGISLVEFVVETDEFLKVLAGLYALDYDVFVTHCDVV